MHKVPVNRVYAKTVTVPGGPLSLSFPPPQICTVACEWTLLDYAKTNVTILLLLLFLLL
jgi:hypothetical protein